MDVLLIEDNRDLAGNLLDHLEACGHRVDWASDGLSGLHLAASKPFDAIVLDLGLPGLDGIELCRRLREEGIATPILVLTARGELDDKLLGLEVGADDYLVKPLSLRELEARLRAHTRRAAGGLERRRLQVGDLILDERTHQVSRQGKKIVLAPFDYQLLRLLMRASPAVLTRERLEAALWGDDPPDSDALRTHIHRLRQAIDRPFDVPLLHTVPHVGYRLAVPDEETPA
ncbi:response regulator transcription factor [Tepidiphilus baoligensis]|uniref:Response regulator n=1 Tax=Tepidiphilus baoligensis TaxID=2698687 RepID=A0ABX1QIV6_9PROT|nr:response regulator transcription factor [Tepidiphilus baoligensis]NMH15938.1 response regulator [Tepidiphilus baoligensis]